MEGGNKKAQDVWSESLLKSLLCSYRCDSNSHAKDKSKK